MRHYFCAAVAALLLSQLPLSEPTVRPAVAQDCATAETVTERIRRETPHVEIQIFDGPRAARLRAGISGLTGQDVPEGGRYLIAHAPAAPTAYVVRFMSGCATHHGRFPDRLLRIWLDGSPA